MEIKDAVKKCPINPAPYTGVSMVVYTTITDPAIVDIPAVMITRSSCLVIEARYGLISNGAST